MIARIAIGLVGLIVLLAAVLVGYSYSVSAPLFDERRGAFAPQIADPDQALTFARSGETLLLVTSHGGDAITGLDLTAALGEDRTGDLLALHRDLGFDGLRAVEASEVTVPLDALTRPMSYTYPHVAAGTNFKAHAEEVYLDDPPFLFPKLVRATPWNAPVPFTSRLDYEAELCMFPLEDIVAPQQLVNFGLVLCNDFTDRWTLVSELDLSAPLGTTGFASGKSCEGCFTTGYLVVIPKDRDFHRNLEIELWVNDELRQRFAMDQMILSIDDIVRQAFEQRRVPYQKGDEIVSLLGSDDIPAGTLILTGTAAGIAFKPVNVWNQGFYLQPGDVVRTEGDFLGHLENAVGPE